MEDYHYLAILNNLFRCFHPSPLKDLTDIIKPQNLVKCCNEMNPKLFAFIKDYVLIDINKNNKNNNNNNNQNNIKETISNLTDIINTLINELKSKIDSTDIEKKSKININELINLDEKEIIHLAEILFVYGIVLSQNKFIYIETVKTCFNKIIRKNIWRTIRYYLEKNMTVNNLEESRIDEESLLEMDDREDKEEIEMKKAINDFIMINNKLNQIENEE